MKRKVKDEAMQKPQNNQQKSEAKAKAELIYQATGRTKIYPEKDFAKNLNKIKARLEKKRKRKNISTCFESNLRD